jgi:AcrR family transcriptional regulator
VEFDEIMMRGIAAAAEVSPGSARSYFGSREDPAMAFYDRSMEGMAPRSRFEDLPVAETIEIDDRGSHRCGQRRNKP